MSDIGRWLEEHGLGKYADAFAKSDIGLDVLPDLDRADMKDLGVSLGDAKRLLKAARTLAHEPSPSGLNPDEATADVPPTAQPRGEAERRQLTVMFCDLVGSTQLSGQLDLETYRKLLSGYQDAARSAIIPYHGFIARYMGDGLLVYFGYPQAHEDDAERAVRAGLDIAATIQHLEVGTDEGLAVRIGIATGQVVAGDIVGEGASEEHAVLGETPNLAARLQGEAEPNSVVISETTRTLTTGLFELERLSPRVLKGISEKVTPYRVRGEIRGQSRFAARSGTKLSPFVGRTEELELLIRRWSRAKAGNGQVVLTVGEAGIGKSRLLQQLRDHLGTDVLETIILQCSPNHQGSALYPSIAAFERVLGFSEITDGGARLAALRRHLDDLSEEDEDVIGLLARLLSLPTEDQFSSIKEMDAAERRERTLSALVDHVRKRAERAPLLCVIEDVHWADPTTRELLGRLVESIGGERVLLLATTRPGFEAEWTDLAYSQVLSLSRLEAEAGAQLAHGVASAMTGLPDDVVQAVLSRAEGNPLFIEELTRAVLQSAESLSPNSVIPATLQDSLRARLDASETGKLVAQCASVIGRTFEHRVLSELWEGPPGRLSEGLNALELSGLISGRGEGDHAQYAFKHALVRDAAYGSLLREQQTALHKRVADGLERAYLSAQVTAPEVVATHFAMAGESEKAAHYRQLAGIESIRNNAFVEAEVHFKVGISLLDEMPASGVNLDKRVEFMLALGTAQMTLYGFGSPEVRQTYTEARGLISEHSAPARRFEVGWGLWLNRNIGGDLKEAQTLIRELDSIVAGSSDPDQRLQAHHAGWTTAYMLGDVEVADARAAEGRDVYSIEQHGKHAFRYGGHDPGVCASAHGALSRWILGYPAQAAEIWRRGMEIATTIGHPGSVGVARTFGAMLFQFKRDPNGVLSLCEDSAGTPRHIESMMWVYRGWATAWLGDVNQGLRDCEEGVSRYVETGANVRLSLLEYVCADVVYLAGRPADALLRITNSVKNMIESAGEAELLRMKGDLLLRQTDADAALAESTFLESLRIAREHKAKSWELRTAASLARLWRELGRPDEARQLLSPIYEWFSEGFDTADLMEAKALLEELS